MGSLIDAPLGGASGNPAIAYTLDPSAFLIMKADPTADRPNIQAETFAKLLREEAVRKKVRA